MYGVLFIAGRGLPGDRATVFAGVRGWQRSRLCRLLVAHLGYLLDRCIRQVRHKDFEQSLGSSQTQFWTLLHEKHNFNVENFHFWTFDLKYLHISTPLHKSGHNRSTDHKWKSGPQNLWASSNTTKHGSGRSSTLHWPLKVPAFWRAWRPFSSQKKVSIALWL